MSVIEPICTPTSLTGDPSVNPLVFSKLVQYRVLRENSRCSLLIVMTATANRMTPIETNAPTLISFVALDSRNRPLPAAAQEMSQSWLRRRAGLVHRPDKVHPTLEEVGDAIPDEEGARDVVRHDDGGDL